MTGIPIMEKTISTHEARKDMSRMIQGVLAKGDKYVVERHGEPVAVLVPVNVYNQWKRIRARFFDAVRKSQQQSNLSAEEAERITQEAISHIRSQEN